MGFTNKLDKISFVINKFLRAILVGVTERENIRNKRHLINSVLLSDEQTSEIQSFYKRHYGKKISTDWHRLYQSYTGKYCKAYFPEYLLSTELEPLINPYPIAEFLGDKNLLPILFQGLSNIHVPKTYVSRVKGNYQDGEGVFLTIEKVIHSLSNIGKCVIKKSVDTSSGRDVQVCVFKNGVDAITGEGISIIIDSFGSDYIVQEYIYQHDTLSSLCPSSVNTFRVMTYICNGIVNVCPVALRIGRNGADRDNIHYGGIVVGVTNDMHLRKTAFSEYGDSFVKHPDTNMVFEDYKVGGINTENICEVAIKLHQRVPHLGIISWDLTIDNNGKYTIIEMNTTGQSAWFPQMVNGEPLFHNNTEKMLTLIYKK